VEEFFEIKGLTFSEMKKLVERIKYEGKAPFFHYTERAGAILKGPLIDEIIADLYSTFNKSIHVGFIVPYKYKNDVAKEINGYGE